MVTSCPQVYDIGEHQNIIHKGGQHDYHWMRYSFEDNHDDSFRQ